MNKEEKSVAFIVGDKNIVKSSIVVFESLKKYEPEIDRFLFLSDINLEEEDKKDLEKLKVKVELLEKEEIFSNSLSWPKECFLNFKVVNELYNLGYDIALKLDYDIIVNGKLDIEINKPTNEIFSSITHNYETLKDMVLNDYEYYEKSFRIREWNKKVPMFGNVYINLKKYVDEKFWEKYKDSYIEIIEKSPSKSADSFFADMGLFALVLEKYDISYKVIEEKYNCCASVRHLSSLEKLDLNPRLIHYSGPKKPWKHLGIRVLSNPYYAYLRQIWIDFVVENTDFNHSLKREEKKKSKIYSNVIKSKIYKKHISLICRLKKGE